MKNRILVINPNSTVAVTEAMDRAVAPLRPGFEGEIRCVTLAEGPPGIESQRQSDEVVAPLCRLAEREAPETAAFVVACFSDPGLHALREITGKPVFGIAESGLLTALTLGERFGIVAILETSIPRHARMIRGLGLEARLAGERAVGFGVTALANAAAVESRMIEKGRALRDDCGADVLVLGCAGMADYRAAMESALGLPVVDPTQAAAAHAVAAVQLGYRRALTGPAQ